MAGRRLVRRRRVAGRRRRGRRPIRRRRRRPKRSMRRYKRGRGVVFRGVRRPLRGKGIGSILAKLGKIIIKKAPGVLRKGAQRAALSGASYVGEKILDKIHEKKKGGNLATRIATIRKRYAPLIQ